MKGEKNINPLAHKNCIKALSPVVSHVSVTHLFNSTAKQNNGGRKYDYQNREVKKSELIIRTDTHGR